MSRVKLGKLLKMNYDKQILFFLHKGVEYNTLPLLMNADKDKGDNQKRFHLLWVSPWFVKLLIVLCD